MGYEAPPVGNIFSQQKVLPLSELYTPLKHCFSKTKNVQPDGLQWVHNERHVKHKRRSDDVG